MMELITNAGAAESELVRIANVAIPASVLFGTHIYVLLKVLREED